MSKSDQKRRVSVRDVYFWSINGLPAPIILFFFLERGEGGGALGLKPRAIAARGSYNFLTWSNVFMSSSYKNYYSSLQLHYYSLYYISHFYYIILILFSSLYYNRNYIIFIIILYCSLYYILVTGIPVHYTGKYKINELYKIKFS